MDYNASEVNIGIISLEYKVDIEIIVHQTIIHVQSKGYFTAKISLHE